MCSALGTLPGLAIFSDGHPPWPPRKKLVFKITREYSTQDTIYKRNGVTQKQLAKDWEIKEKSLQKPNGLLKVPNDQKRQLWILQEIYVDTTTEMLSGRNYIQTLCLYNHFDCQLEVRNCGESNLMIIQFISRQTVWSTSGWKYPCINNNICQWNQNKVRGEKVRVQFDSTISRRTLKG